MTLATWPPSSSRATVIGRRQHLLEVVEHEQHLALRMASTMVSIDDRPASSW